MYDVKHTLLLRPRVKEENDLEREFQLLEYLSDIVVAVSRDHGVLGGYRISRRAKEGCRRS